MHSECTLGCTSCSANIGAIHEGLLIKVRVQGTKVKYVAMQLKTFEHFVPKFELDVIWLMG